MTHEAFLGHFASSLKPKRISRISVIGNDGECSQNIIYRLAVTAVFEQIKVK
jgi:hypothetical protein